MKLVQNLTVLTCLVFLAACSAPDVGTPQQHSTGTCGDETVSDYNNVVITCSLTTSQALADDCVHTADAFNQKYPGINCRAERIKDAAGIQINKMTLDALSSKARETKTGAQCSLDIELAFMRVGNDCLLQDTQFADAATSAKCVTSAEVFERSSPNTDCTGQASLKNGQVTSARVRQTAAAAIANSGYTSGRDCTKAVSDRVRDVQFSCESSLISCASKIEAALSAWPGIACQAKDGRGASVFATEGYLRALKR